MNEDHQPDWDELLARLASTDWQIAIVVSGGGSGVIKRCFGRSGASVNFVEGVVPYSRASMLEYLGCPPAGKSASAETASQLASTAFDRAGRLSDREDTKAAGIALVAALPTIPPRDQVNQIHAAMLTTEGLQSRSRILTEDVQTRDQAEAIAETMIARMIERLV